MARTRRIYNNPKSKMFIHSYQNLCMGNCPMCKDTKGIRKRQTVKRQIYLEELNAEAR